MNKNLVISYQLSVISNQVGGFLLSFFNTKKISAVNREQKTENGFTFLEVIITIALLTTILGIITLSLLNVRNRASLNSSLDLLITDIQDQQLKALSANTQGRTTLDNYGVLVGNSSYTLFHGTYSPSESSNVTINVDYPLSLSTTLPNSQVVFIKSTGEISGFGGSSQNTITIRDNSQNIQKTIQFNSLGVITSVD